MANNKDIAESKSREALGAKRLCDMPSAICGLGKDLTLLQFLYVYIDGALLEACILYNVTDGEETLAPHRANKVHGKFHGKMENSMEIPLRSGNTWNFHKNQVHDRYLIIGDAVWLLGTSVKDMGHGLCAIIKTGFAPETIMELLKQ